MDEKDVKILDVLKKNARLSVKSIARLTGIPVTTVHNRIKKMEKEGLIKGYTLSLDYTKLGKPIMAYILITVDYKLLKNMKKTQHQLAEELKKNDFVEEVDMVTGRNDIIVKVRVSDIQELSNFVTRDLRNINGIDKTETVIVLREV